MPLTLTIDTETTGLGSMDRRGAREDGVVQVGIAYRIPGEEVQTWARYCNPGDHLVTQGRADEALAINHLSVASVLGAPPSLKVASELQGVLARIGRSHGGVELRAYNVSFDRPFLEVPPWNMRHPWGKCLMIETMERFNLERRPRLVDALSIAGVVWQGDLHDAARDAHAALLLHESLSRLEFQR
jgi:DNA polymerase III epsilon subunit-like protein